MTVPNTEPTSELPDGDVTSRALDWIDLVIVLTIAYATVLALHAVGVRVRGAWLGLALAPPVLGALTLRRKYLPGRHRPVQRKLTLLGLLATSLMVGGFLVSGMGGVCLYQALTSESNPVSEEDVRRSAALRAQLQRMPVVEERPLTEEEAAELRRSPTYGGGFDELVAAMDEAPSDDETARIEASVRQEYDEEARERFADEQRRARSFALLLGVIGLALLAIGGLLDSRRALRPVGS